MTHATGHASRLDREGITNPIKFGSERYSKEELIAELGAAFLSNEAGILDQVRFENSAAYLQSWTRKFKDDPTLIVSAASHAQRGFDWVTGRRHEEQENLRDDIQQAPALAAADTQQESAPISDLQKTHSTHSPLTLRQAPPPLGSPFPRSDPHPPLQIARGGGG
jgi:hypothetical protein